MTKVETNRSTMHDRTEEQAQICGNTKVDSMKMNLEKQTLWRDFEGDLIPMLNGINGELSDITTWESKVQSIRERSPMDHTERDKVNDGENSDIVDLKQQENKTEEDSDSVHDSLCALFDD
uniref:Uncharacterized protein n=1 Tax=Romanomermis culicivorax TaxID=13658 RepID=A0A915KX87_ROMCU